MNLTLVDTHSHLYSEPLCQDIDGVIKRARESGVKAIIVPGTDQEDSQEAIQLACKYHGYVFAAIGVHPQSIQEDEDLSWLSCMAQDPHVIAIGEIGLDSEVREPGIPMQERRFLKQLAIAKDRQLPILVHCRGALEKTISILEGWGGKGGILHAWPGSKEATRSLLDKGFYCGVCGVVTRLASTRKRRNLLSFPLEKIVLETDSPYIGTEKSPKGKVEPADLLEICQSLSELYGLPEETIANITTENASKALFSIF
ncbi:MAG: TatD family hydrolase [Candidatus Brocadiae bacterium]|nr:TatD family hydrolase [Candidatus Brocadiia bacterium]